MIFWFSFMIEVKFQVFVDLLIFKKLEVVL